MYKNFIAIIHKGRQRSTMSVLLCFNSIDHTQIRISLYTRDYIQCYKVAELKLLTYFPYSVKYNVYSALCVCVCVCVCVCSCVCACVCVCVCVCACGHDSGRNVDNNMNTIYNTKSIQVKVLGRPTIYINTNTCIHTHMMWLTHTDTPTHNEDFVNTIYGEEVSNEVKVSSF